MFEKRVTGKRVVFTSISLILCLFSGIVLSGYVKLALIWFVVFFALCLLQFRFNDKYSFIADIIFPIGAGFFASYFSCFALFAEEIKATDYNSMISYLATFNKWSRFPEFCIVVLLYFLLRLFIKDRRLAASISPSVIMLLNLLNTYVFLFRGNEVNAGDIASVRTAMNVASEYNFFHVLPWASIVVPYALLIMAFYSFNNCDDKLSLKEKLTVFVPSLLIPLICGCSFMIYCLNENNVLLWINEGTKYNGFTANLIMSAISLNVEVPDGYSTEYMNELAVNYGDNQSTESKPNIIIIMNESFTDITRYNSIYQADYADPLPYFHSLENDTEHAYIGYALSSVYGGGTSISEFEMLTGITSAFMPTNVSPYVMYVNKDTYSLPWELKSHGYRTIAMHPYFSNGWNRQNAYPYMGFDELLFIDDFVYDDSDLMRNYMSDQCAYRNMLDVIESEKQASDAPVFAFLVTMQNHGGYEVEGIDMDYDMYIPGKPVESLFATLLYHSDTALEYLFDYLSNQDEEYIVMMFGDHHPNICTFNDRLGLGDGGFLVPYVIWDNKGLDSGVSERQSISQFTSVNYLGLATLEASGLPMSPYFQFISDIRNVIPEINSTEYYDSEAMEYFEVHNYDVTTPIGHAIQIYRYLQYDSIYDNSSSSFVFPD